MATTTGTRGGRPVVMSARGVVSSGHYLATEAGVNVLRQGGNAFDAAAAVGFTLALTKPQQNGIAGEVPVVLYDAKRRKVHALSGHGTAPAAATLERFRDLGLDIIPGDGFLPAVVPPAVATYILLLREFGTKRLRDVLGPAVQLAETGFAMYDNLRNSIAGSADRFRREWPSSAEVFLRKGRTPDSGTLWRNPDWARTFKRLLRAEAGFRNRKDGLRAAYDEFYRGRIAAEIVRFSGGTALRDASGNAHAGLLTLDDFAGYEALIEEPWSTSYRGWKVYKCGPWTQGPVLLQALNLLEGYDLRELGHNTADYIHTIIECMKLAYADREFYYGDPLFTRVPAKMLLSKRYAYERRDLVDAGRASMQLRPGAMPAIRASSVLDVNAAFAAASAGGVKGDTTKLEVIDAAGNMVSATPSGGWLPSSPVIPGLGFPLGTRGQMFSLVAGHPNCLQPGKRPRTTLTPSLALRGGAEGMVFGSPGGDAQDQWALEFFLNVVEFGMSLQEAVEAPTFWTHHFPSSFYPREAQPGSLYVEERVPITVREELAARGHVVTSAGEWAGGNTLAARFDAKTGLKSAAASPRLEPAYAGAL